MSPNQQVLAPASQERDDEGRLLALRFDSALPLPAAGTESWLIAIDGPECARRITAHAIGQLADAKACALHLVHVQPWLSKEAAEAVLAERALEATAPARELLDSAGLPWRLHVAMGDPADRILEFAARLAAVGVAIGSHGRNTSNRLPFGSVAYKVIHLSPVSVLVVP